MMLYAKKKKNNPEGQKLQMHGSLTDSSCTEVSFINTAQFCLNYL